MTWMVSASRRPYSSFVRRRGCTHPRLFLFVFNAMGMKLLVEIVLAIFLHPVVWVLCVINIVGRSDLSGLQKLVWIIVTFLWGIGPILYVLVGGGAFW